MEAQHPTTLMSILRPVLIVNQIVGVCPHSITQGGDLIFRWKTLRFFRTVISLIIMSLYFIFLAVQFYLSFQRNRSMPDKGK